MKLALIFEREREGNTASYLERACRTLGVAYDHWRLRDAERIPSDYGLYLRIDHGDDYEVRLPERLRPSVFYAIDTHIAHSWPKIRRAARAFDLVFSCHRSGAERLPGAEWLPVGCDPELHGPSGEPPAWDVAFVGTEGAVPRKFYLQALRERYPNSSIGHASPSRLASIYSRARIGFNYSILNDVNMRMFEIMAARTLLVTNALKGDDLRRLGMEDGAHLMLYRDPDELFRLVDRYLSDHAERRRIAEAGHRLVTERHTYVHRMRQLLERAAERLRVAVPAGRESVSCR